MLYHPVDIASLHLKGNIFLAPVAGYSDRAFRSICYECACDFAFTEMVSAEALVRTSGKTATLIKRAHNEVQYGVQLFGGDADVTAQAACIVYEQFHPELIDINAGCPVPKIVKTGSGSALTRDPERLFKIVHAVCHALNEVATVHNDKAPPVTVKIRSGWDDAHITWKEAASAAIEAGAQAITLHPRTRAQGYDGNADWSMLAELVSLFKNRVPIFGSGDVFTPEAAQQMLSQTHCSAVMFARGAMGNPFVFTQTKQLLTQGFYDDIPHTTRLNTGLLELERLIVDMGEPAACREMRKRFCSYAKGVPNAAQVRRIIVQATSFNDYCSLVANIHNATSV